MVWGSHPFSVLVGIWLGTTNHHACNSTDGVLINSIYEKSKVHVLLKYFSNLTIGGADPFHLDGASNHDTTGHLPLSVAAPDDHGTWQILDSRQPAYSSIHFKTLPGLLQMDLK